MEPKNKSRARLKQAARWERVSRIEARRRRAELRERAGGEVLQELKALRQVGVRIHF